MQQTDSPEVESILEENETEDLKKKRRFLRHNVDHLVVYITQLYETGKIPSSTNLFPVRCKDLSRTGIAFWFPTKPNFKRFVVRLGSQDNPIYFEGEIVHASLVKKPPKKKTVRDCDGVEHRITLGPRLFQVGCRFLERIQNPTY